VRKLTEEIDDMAKYREQSYRQPTEQPAEPFDEWRLIKREKIAPLGLNNRRHFDEEGLMELAADIGARGMIQPLVIRRNLAGKRAEGNFEPLYELIAGERRLRAAAIAGLESVPCIVRDRTEEEAQSDTIAENVLREDLSAIEVARGYERLAKSGKTQGEVAKAVGRSQSAVAKALSLLRLPESVQERVAQGELGTAAGYHLARDDYARFPELVDYLAELVMAHKIRASDLEKGFGLNLYWKMGQSGIVRRFSSKSKIDRKSAGCLECPHQAYRAEGEDAFCLLRSHFDELEAAAKAEADEKQTLEIVRATAAHRKAVEAARASGDAKTRERIETADTIETDAPKGETGLPRVQKLRRESYERLDQVRGAPAGCSELCPCRSIAEDYDGGTVSICLDPACFRKLKIADTKTRNAARRETFDRKLFALRALFRDEDPKSDGAIALFHRCLAVLLWSGLRNLKIDANREMKDDPRIDGDPDFLALLATDGAKNHDEVEAWNILAAQGSIDLVRIAAELTVRDEIRTAVEWKKDAVAELDYLLGEVAAEVAPIRTLTAEGGKEDVLTETVEVTPPSTAESEEYLPENAIYDEECDDFRRCGICARAITTDDPDIQTDKNYYCPDCASKLGVTFCRV
jgi:ParB/RepB/Spo0J family partition protein